MQRRMHEALEPEPLDVEVMNIRPSRAPVTVACSRGRGTPLTACLESNPTHLPLLCPP